MRKDYEEAIGRRWFQPKVPMTKGLNVALLLLPKAFLGMVKVVKKRGVDKKKFSVIIRLN